MPMERVWGGYFDGESNVLEVYVRYLRQKLEAAGYVLRADSAELAAVSSAAVPAPDRSRSPSPHD